MKLLKHLHIGASDVVVKMNTQFTLFANNANNWAGFSLDEETIEAIIKNLRRLRLLNLASTGLQDWQLLRLMEGLPDNIILRVGNGLQLQRSQLVA